MSNQKISISVVDRRKMKLSESVVKTSPIDQMKRIKSYATSGKKTCHTLNEIQRFFREAAADKTGQDAITCMSILDDMKKNSIFNDADISQMEAIFCNDVLFSLPSFEIVRLQLKEEGKDPDFIRGINSCISTCEACDRVLKNHALLSSRFNVSQILENTKYREVNEAVGSLCELIDTYKLPIQAKINIALENISYIFDREGISYQPSTLVETATDYFLANTEYITDYSYKKMLSVFENNFFFDRADTACVNYLFEHTLLLEKATSRKTNNKEVDALLEEIKSAKNEKEAKSVIQKAFNLILALYVTTAIITFTTVMIIIGALVALSIAVVATPVAILKMIEDGLRKTIKTAKNGAEGYIERKGEVVEYTEKTLSDAGRNPVKEVCNIIERSAVAMVKELSTNVNYSDMKNVMEFFDSLLESKDFANSEDVEDLIKAYKADQNKGFDRFKRMVERIYISNPETVIDGTCHILQFIRNFLIIGTLAINPIVTIVVFIADKIVEMDLKRKEADKVCNYFKSEKSKVEKVISRSSGDKKERYEEYLKCLDKCIEKLDDYRENLYTDAELERMNAIDEAASIGYTDKKTLEEYFATSHENVCRNVDVACQMIGDEVRRNSMGMKNTLEYVALIPYSYMGDEKISKTIRIIEHEAFKNQFLTKDGLVNIPLYKVHFHSDVEMTTITEIISYVNGCLSKNCILNLFDFNNKAYISLTYLDPIINDTAEFSCPEEIMEAFADIELFGDLVDSLAGIEGLDDSLNRNIEKLVKDDLDTIAEMVKYSYANKVAFKESLIDYKHAIYDVNETTMKIDSALYILESPVENMNEYESAIVEADSTAFLLDVIQELKVVQKLGDVVDGVKAKFGADKVNSSIKRKERKDKASKMKATINSKVGLTGEAIKKGLQSASMKEKEISKDIDVRSASMKKSIEKALTTDRREAIIKGSVVPSFSKIIKSGIVIGGIAAINPVIAAIGTLGALATSKKLTDKERQLLLDEIDIELKTVEKEISRAESEGKMKEYKALLTYQRKLQREQQRIKYKLKLFNKQMPSVKGEDD